MRKTYGFAVGWILLLGTGLAWAQTSPTIRSVAAPASARIMTEEWLDVTAVGGDRPLVYSWTILQNPTGAAASLLYGTQKRALLQIYWESSATAQQAVGQTLQVQVQVSFAEPIEGDEPAVATADILLSAVNHAPVAVISGNLGTEAARIPAGRSIQMNSFESTDQDGDSFRSDWSFGTTRGGTFVPTAPPIYGSEGAIASFTVPSMTADIDQEIVLQLSDGLHSVTARRWAYLTPSLEPPPDPNIAPTLEFVQTTVAVTQGQTAVFQVNAADNNGDDLVLTWLFNANPVGGQYIQTIRNSATSWASTLSYPTGGLTPGTYSITAQAFETSTPDLLGSPLQSATLIAS